nr:FumA C-terminus/TtdB family hydratase beta subunit [uncultured Caproiciproducens sp.]
MDRLQIHTNDMAEAAKTLRAGDKILLSGTIYTARDAAHKRLFAMLDSREKLPFELKNASVYYAGPTPAPDNLPIGACGPTTSSRMDLFAPRLLDLGLKCMIGKGGRSQEVIEAIRRNNAVYLCAIGGAGALAAKCVRSMKVLAFEDLGCESIKELQIEDFPLFTAIDCCGGSLFEV